MPQYSALELNPWLDLEAWEQQYGEQARAESPELQAMRQFNQSLGKPIANPYQEAMAQAFGASSPFATGYTNIGGVGYSGMGYATPGQLAGFAADPGNIYSDAYRAATQTQTSPAVTVPGTTTTTTGTTTNTPAAWKTPVFPGTGGTGIDDIFARGGSSNLGGLLGKSSPYKNPFKQ